MTTDYLKITFKPELQLLLENDESRLLPFSNSSLYETTILHAEYLSNGDDVKSVINLSLSRKNIEYEYEPGNTIGILPQNDENEVNLLMKRLNLEEYADVPYFLNVLPNVNKKSVALPKHLPHTGTLRYIFINNIDIRSPPKKLFLKKLCAYSSGEDYEKLEFLSSSAGSEEYNILVAKKGKILLNLLNSIPSCKPPVERLLENLPALQPRPYSISSSPLECDTFEITFSVIEHDKETKGVCTGFLEKLALFGDKNKKRKQKKIKFYFRKSNNFLLPGNLMTPIIMMGSGTGVAPFIGFLKHRMMQKYSDELNFGQAWLFYGCRYSERDYLFKNQIHTFLHVGILNKLFVCFSREGEKKYVQHLIRENAEDLANMIVYHNAVIFICGDKKHMISDTQKEVINTLCGYAKMNEERAHAYLSQMVKDNRFVIDSWL